jgi:hypothetical protein
MAYQASVRVCVRVCVCSSPSELCNPQFGPVLTPVIVLDGLHKINYAVSFTVRESSPENGLIRDPSRSE